MSAPLRILSFDIETMAIDSSFKKYREEAKMPVIQIANMLTTKGIQFTS
jgi:hypothetical protein